MQWVNMCPPSAEKKEKWYVQVLIPNIYECDLIWKKEKAFADILKNLEMRSS